MALATLVGLLSTLLIPLLLSSPTLAKPSTNYPSSITLAQSSNQLTLTTSGNGGISAVGHSLTITTTGELLGYTVTMSNTSSTTSAMVDKADSNKIIPSIPITTNTNPQSLANSTYGYTLAKVTDLAKDQLNSPIWHGIPLLDTTPAELTKQDRPTAAEGDTIDITYGINTTGTKPGDYTTTIQYTATVSPKPIPMDAKVCRSGDITSACQVDLDTNMIPIKYTGSTDKAAWTVADPSTIGWYDYGNKQWANAVTVSKEALNANKYKNVDGTYKVDTVVDNNDILGYWVYIPRYAYEVMRPNAVDKVVTDKQAIKEGGFKIMFETKDDVKKVPHPTCNKLNPTRAEMWQGGEPNTDQSNILAKDYRTDCTKELGFSREYPGNNLGKSEIDQQTNQNSDTTWATHPAFSWCKTTSPDGTKTDCAELNGIWVGKFETTGTTKSPTILPNVVSMYGIIGDQYAVARSLGVYDKNNVGGNTLSDLSTNSHNLSVYASHMLKNSEWGAISYLSLSKYGAGVNQVQFNANTDYITGCGTLNTTSAACNSYNTNDGQLTSTSGNVYGIYDMTGGRIDYVMGNVTTSSANPAITTANTLYFETPAKEPYVDLYRTSNGFERAPVWSTKISNSFINNDVCTWATCGGDATHETNNRQSISANGQSWGWSSSYFAYGVYPWFHRGGSVASSMDTSGLVLKAASSGGSGKESGFHITLIPK